MPDVFSALANPVRRALLEALRDGPLPAGELASRFALSRPAVSEHLQVLRTAALVREEPRGRHRYYHLEPGPLEEVGQWLHPFEQYWRGRMRALRDLLDDAPQVAPATTGETAAPPGTTNDQERSSTDEETP